jgi:hypothetical protein
MTWILLAIALGVIGGIVAQRRGERWGSTAEERSRVLPGDSYLNDSGRPLIMTRGISIDAPPDQVWPWIAQLGRGAGWYSIDRLDNGGRSSAWHRVSWIPEPRRGDASAIGYLREISPGKSLVWWVDRVQFMGASARLATYYGITAIPGGTRLICRMSAVAQGKFAGVALVLFRLVDSIMATRQLKGIRDRVDQQGDGAGHRDPETGERDQYQLYEVIFASGEKAGIAGTEGAMASRRAAIAAGVLEARHEPTTYGETIS